MKPTIMAAERPEYGTDPGRALRIEVQIGADRDTVPSPATMEDWIRRTADVSGLPAAGDVAVRVVGADEMRALNRRFRKQDSSTNVLAFPAGEFTGLPSNAGRTLGDIVICADVVRSEAALQNKQVADHWGHMLVHGMLHLLGLDHADPMEAADMERLEARILASRGVADPYATS